MVTYNPKDVLINFYEWIDDKVIRGIWYLSYLVNSITTQTDCGKEEEESKRIRRKKKEHSGYTAKKRNIWKDTTMKVSFKIILERISGALNHTYCTWAPNSQLWIYALQHRCVWNITTWMSLLWWGLTLRVILRVYESRQYL